MNPPAPRPLTPLPLTYSEPAPFCGRLKRAIKYAGLTSGQLSRLMGFNVGTIRRNYLESVPDFKQRETRDKIKIMADRLDVNFTWLLFGEISEDAKDAIQAFQKAARQANITPEDRAKIIDGLEMR